METEQRVILYGHRGARFEAPENTLTGFRHALRQGITAFEFDVHLSADDQLVVIHDATVDRTTNGTGAGRGHDRRRAGAARCPIDLSRLAGTGLACPP